MRLHWLLLVGVSALLLAIVFSCVALVGCSNYCLNVQTNPGGTINTNTSCQTTTMTGNVALSIGALQDSDSPNSLATEASRATQVFVTLRGVDALADPLPSDDAPAWRELAPQLASRPAQIDLNAPVGDFCAITGPPGPRLGEPRENGPLGTATVPAGVYRQLRLRVVPNSDSNAAANPPSDQSAIVSSLPDQSACGANLLNCLIPPDSAAVSLALYNRGLAESGERNLETGPASIVIPSGRIAGGFFRVLPNTTTHLAISFDPRSSSLLRDANSLRLVPSFSVATASCASPE